MDDTVKNKPTDWYVLHTLTGQEQKVEKSIRARKSTEEMGDYIGDVFIPTEKITDVKDKKKRTITKKAFPGYVFVQLNLYDKRHEFLEPTWRFLRETPGVIGFIGGDKPAPLTEEEMENIRHVADEEEQGKPAAKPRVSYEPGEMIKIIDGAFMSLTGTVDEVDPEHGKLKVSVQIFGRSAPVDLEYWQVERYVEEPTLSSDTPQ
ncbi:MAG: transcription termination/antitermination factor NusG [Kiritimatiellae bacterium]|nr:transcription termination/antitermination factor NusG [Kiritimatiellia bacterium]